MKKIIIFSYKRDELGVIAGKKALRSVNVHSTFKGIGERGVIIASEFNKLALDLEPSMEGYTVVDI